VAHLRRWASACTRATTTRNHYHLHVTERRSFTYNVTPEIMKECQHREHENIYSSLSAPNSNREQTPDLDFSKEGKINSSHLVQTKTSIETKAEKKNTPHSDPRKISPNEKFNQLFSSENFEGANSVDSKMDQSIRWEMDSSDTDEGSYSTDSDSNPSILTPGMVITGNSKVYNVEEILGSGTFGEVARCYIEGQDKVVALKVMSRQYENEFLNEVQALQILNKLTHFKHCFVKLNDSFTYQGFLYQEFELLDQTLFDYMKKRGGPLKVAEVRAIAQQILIALCALKQFGITHPDIKVEDIMLVNHEAQPFRVKLIDFGLACNTERLPQKGIYQALPYRAPEITLGLPRDDAIATWSLGCLLSDLFLDCFGTLVSDYFKKRKNGSECSWKFKTLKQYEKKRGAVSTRADAAYDDLTTLDNLFFSQNTKNLTENEDIKAFLDLVKKMLTVDPANRILPADALKHPFITMEHLDGSSDKRYAIKRFIL
uniref:Protein kinase domain-containing protein n=1 Tax=Nothobranchius furzeri TaxID=105023 RepID=A0A8C6MBA8_NOTFU